MMVLVLSYQRGLLPQLTWASAAVAATVVAEETIGIVFHG